MMRTYPTLSLLSVVSLISDVDNESKTAPQASSQVSTEDHKGKAKEMLFMALPKCSKLQQQQWCTAATI